MFPISLLLHAEIDTVLNKRSFALVLFAAFVGLGDLALVYKNPDNGAYRGMQTFKGTHLSAPLRYEDTYKPRQSIREPFFIVVSAGHDVLADLRQRG